MSAARQRREKAKRVGLLLQSKYRDLVEASGEAEIQTAAIVLGDAFNTHIEFIINVMKDYGGLEVKFEPMTTARTDISATKDMNAAELAAHYKRQQN